MENSSHARACNILYEPIRDFVLSSFPWKFALKRSSLASLDMENAYAKPSGCLRVIGTIPVAPFEVEGDILTKQRAVELRYISRVTDEKQFPPQFVEVFCMAPC